MEANDDAAAAEFISDFQYFILMLRVYGNQGHRYGPGADGVAGRVGGEVVLLFGTGNGRWLVQALVRTHSVEMLLGLADAFAHRKLRGLNVLRQYRIGFRHHFTVHRLSETLHIVLDGKAGVLDRLFPALGFPQRLALQVFEIITVENGTAGLGRRRKEALRVRELVRCQYLQRLYLGLRLQSCCGKQEDCGCCQKNSFHHYLLKYFHKITQFIQINLKPCSLWLFLYYYTRSKDTYYMKGTAFILTATLALTASLSSCSPKVSSKDSRAGTDDRAVPYVTVRTDVPNKAFYKDVFTNGGIALDRNIALPYLDAMGLSSEYVGVEGRSRAARDIQNSLLCGNENDANGVILYPDGEPRFRMFYVCGGLGDTAGRGLEVRGRENLTRFVDNGGCYVGNCAGAYLAGTGSSLTYYGGYVGVWPANVDGASTPVWAVGYIIPKDSPLLRYNDFGGDFYVDSVRHHNGPYFEHFAQVPGTEVLSINDYPAYKFHHQPSAIAYKANCFKGRVIPIGGHPEPATEGEKLDLMCAFVQYALDGQGCAKAKAILSNGEVCKMTKSTEDNDPARTKIGDKQCHHFVFSLPKKARNVVVRLESLENYELSLRLANGTFAFKEDARYSKEGKELVKELKFDELPAGTWYIGVQCEDTVEAKNVGDYYEYSNTAILNGAPYTISVKWDEIECGNAVLCKGIDVNEKIKQMINPKLVSKETDSTVTKIVFKTSSPLAEGVRIDDAELSEEPVYASIRKGVVTVSTPAKSINAGKLAGFIFAGFTSLKTIENINALDTGDAVSLMSVFDGCSSLEKVDISGWNTGKLRNANGMFQGMKSLKEVKLCSFSSETARKATTKLFVATSDKPEVRCCSKSKAVKVYCNAEDADWLVKKSSLSNLRSGKEKGEKVDVQLLDIVKGNKIKADWK